MISNLVHRLKRPIGAAFVGALTTFAFSPYQIWPLAFFSVAALLLLIHGQSAKKSAWIGYAWGLGQFATGISWVHVSIDNFGGMPKIASLVLMTLLVGYLAIYSALFTGLLTRFAPNNDRTRFFIVAPALWLVCDWLRGWVMTGFPWLWLGYSQIDSPLASFAPIGGVELITLLIVISAAAISYAILHKHWLTLVIPATILATGFGLRNINWVTLNPESATKVALVQGNIEQELKWVPSQRWPTIMKYIDLTRQNWDADIIIWPEAAIPAFEFEISSFLANLDSNAKANHSAVITGVVNQDSQRRFYNSILSLGETSYGDYSYDLEKRYHKHHLLPFGEFVPFEEILRPIAPFFNLPMSSFSRGDFIQPNIDANGKQLAPALCYEIIFGEQVRENITDDTDFILTLSNDAWFGRSIGPLQHMEIARMRALEFGKPVIRSTNNGVTAVTDYKGNITAEIPQFETGVLRTKVTSTTGQTPYHGYGSWSLYLWVAVCAITGWRMRRTR
ncbi:apolipoprotein N-acyltransferase [Vibrio sp. 404]|uniref:Apolipoprotein N-acyltransferase n=1 Tax=Vibrio marinisediminis TaxID=2758441 RepID=A0A7W2FSF4_9VIBR|nr:apolipoprotein N-acyltransferase [Vibrio marinisediminis]MBA5763410.1 apolipoprotein N-acyltransferase [Vibrio marinisediminis]